MSVIYSHQYKLKNNSTSNILILYTVIISSNKRHHPRCKLTVFFATTSPLKGRGKTLLTEQEHVACYYK